MVNSHAVPLFARTSLLSLCLLCALPAAAQTPDGGVAVRLPADCFDPFGETTFAGTGTPSPCPNAEDGSRISLSAEEVHEVPGTLGGEGLRAVLTLPGMSTPVSGLGYGVFRGTEPATSAVFLDGVRVPVLFHVLALPQAFSPDFISSVELVRGNAPVELPPLLGAAVLTGLAHSADGKAHATLNLDLISLRAFVDVPIDATGTEVTAAARIAYSPLLFAAVYNARPTPAGTPTSNVSVLLSDYQASVQQRLGTGTLRLLGFGLVDSGGFTSATAAVEPFLATHRVDLRWLQPAGAGQLEAGATWGWDRFGGSGGGQTSRVALQVTERSLAARLAYRLAVAGAKVQVGADFDHRQSDFEQISDVSVTLNRPDRVFSSVLEPVATLSRTGVWAQAMLEPWSGWTITPALRVEDEHLVPGMENLAVEPRLSVRAELTGSLALRASAGYFTQPPTLVLPLPVAEAWGLRNGLQEQLQFNLGLDAQLPWGLTGHLDAYANPLLRTVELSLFDSDFLNGNARTLEGSRDSHGWSAGAEVLVRKQLTEHWFGWVSYSFQQSVRSESFVRHDAAGAVVEQARALLPSAYNQAHVFSAVASYRLPRGWTVGAGLHFNTGAPESGGLASITARPGTDANNLPAWRQVDRDQVDRLPSFFRVDAKVAKTWTLAGGRSIELSLDVLDVSLSKEVVRYNYNANATSLPEREAGKIKLEKSAFGLPPVVLPMLGVKATL